jgi:hypothetical protein
VGFQASASDGVSISSEAGEGSGMTASVAAVVSGLGDSGAASAGGAGAAGGGAGGGDAGGGGGGDAGGSGN